MSVVSRIPGSWLHFTCARACVSESRHSVARTHSRARCLPACSRTEICTSAHGGHVSAIVFRAFENLRRDSFGDTQACFGKTLRVSRDEDVDFLLYIRKVIWSKHSNYYSTAVFEAQSNVEFKNFKATLGTT